MEFLFGPITRKKSNVQIAEEMAMTSLQVSCCRGKFNRQTQRGTPSTNIYTRWGSGRDGLECHAPMS